MARVSDMTISVSADVSALRRALWRARLGFWLLAVRQRVVAIVAPVWRTRAEILLALAMLGGWGLLTLGVAELTTPKVWPVSVGLMLLACCGWRMLWTVVSYGLYGLTRGDNG